MGRSSSRRARPEADWIDVPAPQLRIVAEDDWQAAHARLDARRAVYLRGTKGGRSGGRRSATRRSTC